MKALRWEKDALLLLDQSLLPGSRVEQRVDSVAGLCDAIACLKVRGAPAIGIAGAYGCVLAAREAGSSRERLRAGCGRIRETRPTAVNLAWAVDRVLARLEGLDPDRWQAMALDEAREIEAIEQSACRAMSRAGAGLIREGGRYLTHCNAGPLATGGMGSALGVFLEARAQGLEFEVLADETRPLLQGARLTMLELQEAGIAARLITDSMAAFAMRRLGVDGVFVGADRIAANGDTANKIGSYGLALAARHHGVPFHVVAPVSTIDPDCSDGEAIPIEERDPAEVRGFAATCWAPRDAKVWNPAFDVVPAEWITSIITERGVLEAPFGGAIRQALNETLTPATAGKIRRP